MPSGFFSRLRAGGPDKSQAWSQRPRRHRMMSVSPKYRGLQVVTAASQGPSHAIFLRLTPEEANPRDFRGLRDFPP